MTDGRTFSSPMATSIRQLIGIHLESPTPSGRSCSTILRAEDSRRLDFGLGTAARVDSIVVRWPSGKVDTLGPRSADQELLIREGQGIMARQAATRIR